MEALPQSEQPLKGFVEQENRWILDQVRRLLQGVPDLDEAVDTVHFAIVSYLLRTATRPNDPKNYAYRAITNAVREYFRSRYSERRRGKTFAFGTAVFDGRANPRTSSVEESVVSSLMRRLEEIGLQGRDVVEEGLHRRDIERAARTAVDKMTAKERAVFLATYAELLPRSAIATRLKISEDLVSATLFRAKEKLRAALRSPLPLNTPLPDRTPHAGRA